MVRSTTLSTSCPPRYATRRRPERESFGHELAAVAEKLGQPFMPWQTLVAEVGCEIDPDTGLPAYREVRVTVPRQSGKSISVNERLLTANRGWIRFGDVAVGDEVFHPAGHPVAVTFVSDVQHGHDCFRVTTVDGRSVVADAEHLWQVTDKRAERSRGSRADHVSWFEQRIVTTRDMFDSGLSRYRRGGRTSTTGGKSYATNEYRFVLPTQELLKSPDVDLPVDPYLLGAWLGNGDTGGATLTCHADDVEHWSATARVCGFVPTPRRDPRKANTWRVGVTTTPGAGRQSRSFAGALRALGVLVDKHIPEQYLAAGTAQREALLQGLLDTDGSIDPKRGQVEFCSMLPTLAEGVLFLARSLGWRTTLKTGRAMLNGRDYGTKYRVHFTPKRADPAVPFRLARKLARVQERDGGKGRATLSVASVEPVESVPVRCIKVDSPDGLFLAGRDLIPTHNTTLFLSWQINRCVSRRWSHPQRCAFTAQTGKDARDKWLDELFPLIRNSKLKSLVAKKGSRLEINEGMGNESIRFKTGSLIRLLSTATTSGHSKTLHQAVLDEIWHDIDDRREQGLRPAMITVDDAQLLVCSTAGTHLSVVLNRKVQSGREAVLADTGRGVAYFEWSAPEGWDPCDEASYVTFMPALCPAPPCRCAGPGESWRHTITSLDAIRDEREEMKSDGYAEFRRAYGNLKTNPGEALRWRVISKDDWLAAEDPDTPAKQGLALALYVNPESTHAAIGAGWLREDGDLSVAIFDHRPGLGWAVGRMVELAAKWRPCRIVVDPAGAVGAVLAELNEALATIRPKVVELTPMKVRDVCAAYGMIRNGIATMPDPDLPDETPDAGEPAVDESLTVPVTPTRRVRVRPHPALSTAVADVLPRYVGGMKAFDWKSTTDLSTLFAATNAVWGIVTAPPPPAVWEGNLYGSA